MQKSGWLVVLLCLIHLCLFQTPATAQSKKVFVITGKIVPELATSDNGIIEMTKTGAEPTTIEVPRNGRFRIELEYFNEYTLTFMLKGHFSKTIIVSTDLPQEVWKRDSDFPPFPMVVQLFKEIEGIDKSFTLKASGRIFYGKQTDNFEKESIFNDTQIAEQITAATKQAAEVKKEVHTITKQEALDLITKQKNFDQLITEADALFKRSDYPMALLKYQEAQKLFPEKAYPNDRIAELQDLVKALEITDKQKAEIEQKYKSAIARANGYFDQKTYKEARNGYDEALVIKPGDAVAKGRIQEIDLLLDLLEKQQQFDILIAKADKLFDKKDYINSQSDYRKALTFKADETYPTNRIKEIDQILEKEQQAKVLDDRYNSVIANADKSFKSESYVDARKIYTEALTIKPNEGYPTGQISKIDQLLAEKVRLQQIESDFQAILAKGDAAFNLKEYNAAKTQYTSALSIKSNSEEVASKIKNIDSILQKIADDKKKEEDRILSLAAAKEKGYTDAIAMADQLFDKKDYITSQSDYRKALTFKADESYPANRIKEIDQILEKEQQAKVLDDRYNSVIVNANKSFKSESYVDARKIYTEALTIKPNEVYPTGQISKIDQLLAEKARLQQIDTDFQALVAKGDAAFNLKEYEAAKTQYTSALSIKSNSADVLSKIKNIDNILQQLVTDKKKVEDDRLLTLLAAKDKTYNETITKGNNQIEQKTYSDARITFQEAKKLKPTEQLPDQMIAKIDSLIAANERELAARLKEEANQKSRQESQDKSFTEAMTKADKAFSEDDFNTAKTSYQTALTIKGSDPTAKEKLVLTEAKLAKLAKLTQDYNTAINVANKHVGDKQYKEAKDKYQEALNYLPNSDYPKRQIEKLDELLVQASSEREKEELYAAAVNEGEALFTIKDYSGARIPFVKASGIKPSEPLPVRRIKEIDKLLADIALEAAKNKVTESGYMESIKRADQAFAGKEYPSARLNYSEALSIKPNEEYPKSKITEIDKLLVDLKIQQYNLAIAAGDVAFKSDLFDEATSQYELALASKAKDPYATKQLGEITKRRALLLAEKTGLKKIDDQYATLIADAYNNFKSKEYQKAKGKYQDALSLKPAEVLPKEQIAKIDVLMKELAIAEETNRLYTESVKTAQEAFRQNKLKEARDAYQKAHDYKPSEPTPPLRISELDTMIAKLEETAKISAMEDAQKLAKEKAAKEKYDKAIAIANKSFTAKQYIAARSNYSNALTILPNEKYPKDQLSKIELMIAQQEKIALLAKQQAMKDSIVKVRIEAYNLTMSSAKVLEQSKQYQSAILKYKEAIEIKPIEKTNIQKLISSIEDKIRLANIPQAVIQSKPAVTAPIYNPVESAQATEARAQAYQPVINYDVAISKADDAFGIKDYTVARFFYYKASELKSKEEYPKNQIELIRKLVDSEMSAVDRSGYQQAILQADEAFQKKNYSVARFFYYKAIGIKSYEKYPKDRIQEILALTNSLLSEKEEKAYRDLIARADEAFIVKDISIARFYYNKAIVIKANEEYPRIKLYDIQKLIDQNKQDLRDVDYNKLIEQADKALKSESFMVARFNYNKALIMRPNDKYPKDQLILIMETLDKRNNH